MHLGELTPFRTAVLIVFGVAIIGGLAAFALFSGGGDSEQSVSLTMWGPYESIPMKEWIEASVEEKHEHISITYQRVPYSAFDSRFIEALASQRGPDLVFLPQDRIVRHLNKLSPISFEEYPQREFQEAYVEAAEVFQIPGGIVALPVTIDPMVMYWNRDLFNQEAITHPPTVWSDLNRDQYQRLTQREGQTITQSLIALGGYENITNAKDIIATLALQGGTPIVEIGARGPRILLADQIDQSTPGISAVRFYTQFADPVKSTYSWNNSLPSSRQYFVETNLALYLGFASEYDNLQEQNPNLNMAVELMPQRSGTERRATMARVEALAVPRQSQKRTAAVTAARALTSREAIQVLANQLDLPPIRRDLLADRPPEAHTSIFYESAIWAKTWLDPDPDLSDGAFRGMIRAIRSGAQTPSEAVGNADSQLESFLGS